jgi:multiple sugar transport system substrate-binding protein
MARNRVSMLPLCAAACVSLGLLFAAGCKRKPRRTPLALVVVKHDDSTAPWFQRCEQEFELANPNADLEVSIVEPDALREALGPSGSPGALRPDIAIVNDAALAECATRGEALDVAQYYPQYAADFLDLPIRMATYQGKSYGLPVGLSIYGLYCNEKLLQAAGKSPPRTWDDLLACAKAMTRPPQGVYGFAAPTAPGEAAPVWYAFAVSAGGEVIAPDGKWVGSSPGSGAALTFLTGIVRKQGVMDPSDVGVTGAALETRFADGKIAMLIGSTGTREQLGRALEPMKYQVVPIPGKKQPVSLATAETFVVMKSTKHPDVAARFAAFFFDDGRQLDWAKTFSVIPTKKSVAEPPEPAPSAAPVEPLFEKQPLREDPSWKMQFDLLPSARFVPLFSGRADVDAKVDAALVEVYAGTKSPQQALSELQTSLGALR